MADTAVALDTLQALEIHAQFAAQVAFDDILAFLDRVNDLGELLFGQSLARVARSMFARSRICTALTGPMP